MAIEIGQHRNWPKLTKMGDSHVFRTADGRFTPRYNQNKQVNIVIYRVIQNFAPLYPARSMGNL